MLGKNIQNITSEFIRIIQENSPEKSINIISKIECTDGFIGKKNALKIYINFANNSVSYDINKHKNNITDFKKLVKKNIEKAKKCV